MSMALSFNMAASTVFELLLPQPHEVVPAAGECKLPDILGVSDEFKDARLARQLARHHPTPGTFLTIKKAPMPKGDEAYVLKIAPTRIEVSAAAPAGAFHALKTLEQLARGGAPLPCGTIRDWPDLQFRGVHLTAGGIEVPTNAMFRLMVEEMANPEIQQAGDRVQRPFSMETRSRRRLHA